MRREAWHRAFELQRGNLLRRLDFIHGDMNARVNRALEDRGYGGLTGESIKVLAYLGREGATAAELAREHGMPRQTMSRLVNQLCDEGYLKKKPDPEDNRAYRLFLTRRGVKLIREAFAIVHAIERELGELIGEDDFAAFLSLVGQAFGALGLRYPRSVHHVDFDETPPSRLQIQLHSVGAHAERRIAEMSFDDDAEGLVDSHWRLLEQIPHLGTRVADLASVAGLSKQRTSALVRQLLERGLLESSPDPDDARSNRLRYNDASRSLVAHRMAHTALLLADLRCALGPEAFEQLELHARRLFQIMGGRAPAPIRDDSAADDAADALLRDWTQLLYWMATAEESVDVAELLEIDEEGVRLRPELLERLLRQGSVAPDAASRSALLGRVGSTLGR